MNRRLMSPEQKITNKTKNLLNKIENGRGKVIQESEFYFIA